MTEMPKNLHCPQCGSNKLFKDGLRYLKDGSTTQRWLCRNCFYRFSEQKALQKSLRGSINSSTDLFSNRQVCDCLTEASKNLTTVETRQEQAQREGTAPNIMEQKGRMAELAWSLKKANYADETIRMVNSALRTLIARGANLSDPETVKDVIARQNWSENRRRNVANAYQLYANKYGIKWEKPKTRFARKIPFIPKEDELDSLIAGSHRKLAAFLLLLKETAMRSGEATKLKWTDLDEERRLITLNNPEKGSNPIRKTVSEGLPSLLAGLPQQTLSFQRLHVRRIRALSITRVMNSYSAHA
ncbi:tyrosine-type recombinase/integrase [Candidatus Bathyarchaeota archaeon A05DMB-2]|nr:tyrosine-type recombinase/integrase [Candidatus Bathyarchaeota archaeon A05DMB-2]